MLGINKKSDRGHFFAAKLYGTVALS